jgi:hypothetical protein
MIIGLILLLIFIHSIIIGYIIATIINKNNNQSLNSTKLIDHKITQQKRTELQQHDQKPIIIDESKFVIKSDTTKLEKKFDSLGTTTQSSENISGSVDKLKNMKG